MESLLDLQRVQIIPTARAAHPQHPYGLPHALSRPGQREAVDWLRALPPAACAVVSAPTGSGKTAFAAALGADEQAAISLVKTKSLQMENYGEGYRFDVLYGRGNYDCENPEALDGASAADCMYSDNMHDCPEADSCGYLRAKLRAKSSARASLNYAYWLTSIWPREKLHKLSTAGDLATLVMDEAHQLSDITLDWTSVTVSMRDRLQWDLPAFPVLYGHASERDAAAAQAWLLASLGCVRHAISPLRTKRNCYNDTHAEDDLLTEAEQKLLSSGERLEAKLENTLEALAAHAGDWYLRSGPGAVEHAGAPMPGFVARPLTARYHFPRLFLGAWRSVMMSATIGDPQTFAEELGLPAGYVYRDIPNQWAPDTRPVYALPAPAMGYATRNDEMVQAEQARVIGEAIQACPEDWGGIIHVTRKTEAEALARRLARYGLGRRIWTPQPTDSTDWQLRRWNEHKRHMRGRGPIAITWAWWEGFNGLDEKICIVAKAPFPSLGDDYERARMNYSGTMFLQRTAWNLEQALGRTRRGRAEDYDSHGQRRGLVAIADGNWTRCRKYLSPSVSAAIVEGQP